MGEKKKSDDQGKLAVVMSSLHPCLAINNHNCQPSLIFRIYNIMNNGGISSISNILNNGGYIWVSGKVLKTPDFNVELYSTNSIQSCQYFLPFKILKR